MTLLASPLWRAAEAVDRRRSRSRQLALGVSAIGLCRRRAAYINLRIRPSDSPSRREAILGTWIHKGALSALRSEHGAFTVVRVAGPDARGKLDAYYPPADLLPARRVRDPLLGFVGVVEDVKTLGTFAAPDLLHDGPYREHLWQVHVYADLLRANGAPTNKDLGRFGPLPVDLVRIRYLRRDDGAETVFEQPFDPSVAKAAWRWLAQVRQYTDPRQAPRDHAGPTTSPICARCPFLSRCWPPREDGKAPEASLVVKDEDVHRQLDIYHRASRIEASAKARKAQARARLDAAEPGTYGPYTLSWRGGRPTKRVTDEQALVLALIRAGLTPPMALDVPKAERIAVDAGLTVPKKTVRNHSSPSIRVDHTGEIST